MGLWQSGHFNVRGTFEIPLLKKHFRMTVDAVSRQLTFFFITISIAFVVINTDPTFKLLYVMQVCEH